MDVAHPKIFRSKISRPKEMAVIITNNKSVIKALVRNISLWSIGFFLTIYIDISIWDVISYIWDVILKNLMLYLIIVRKGCNKMY